MRVDAATSDADLLRAMPHDPHALDILDARYRPMATMLAGRVTADDALAEDAVQEAFLTVWRNASRYDAERGSVRVWLMTVVHHRAVDVLRRRRPTTHLPDTGEPVPDRLCAPDVWPDVEAGLDASALRRAMVSLSGVQRVAIELAYFGGLTQVEIAERTATPLGTVKSRVRTGLLALRRQLRQHTTDAAVWSALTVCGGGAAIG